MRTAKESNVEQSLCHEQTLQHSAVDLVTEKIDYCFTCGAIYTANHKKRDIF